MLRDQILHMARRTGSESNTIQAQDIFSVGFNLPAFRGETIYNIGLVLDLDAHAAALIELGHDDAAPAVELGPCVDGLNGAGGAQ